MSAGRDIAQILTMLRDSIASVRAGGDAVPELDALVSEIVTDPERAGHVISTLSGMYGSAMEILAHVTNSDPDLLLDRTLMGMIDHDDRCGHDG